LDSTYDNRWCSSAADLKNDDGMLVGYTPTSTQCDHYKPEEIAQIPPMAENVRAALEFLGKDDDGFFLMYEQGDIDWAAHANHMDDMLGAMLDIHDSTQVIIDWIKANGGWEKNALYVTADHDHYLTLLDHFPRVVAMNIVMGTTHNMTPQNNSNKNPWSAAIGSKAYEDETKTQTELLKQYATWTDEDIEAVGHFWGPRGSGGNGWGSHSTRPVGLYYQGDDGCVEALVGKGFQVLGRDVEGSPEKIDQVHIHACMMKQLFNL
jgi:alkaline phosphatase